MTTSTVPFTEERVKVAGTELYVLQGGSGTPILVLHGVEGFEGWLAFYDALAEQATVYAPSHPGYGQTPCPDWLETIAHQAVFYHWFLQQQAFAPVDVVGIGLGGWIAAQMAVMCPQHTLPASVPSTAKCLTFLLRPGGRSSTDVFTIRPTLRSINVCSGGNFRSLGGPAKLDVPRQFACVFDHSCMTDHYQACWRKCTSPRSSCGVPRTRSFLLNVDSCTNVPSQGQPCGSSSSVATGHNSSARRSWHGW